MKTVVYLKNLIKYIKHGGVVYTNVTISSNEHLLNNKVALITGGSSGFGLAIAKKYISSGCKVIITGRNKHKLDLAVESLNSNNVRGIVWDLCDYSLAGKKLLEVEKVWGPIDIAVNNAGVWIPQNWITTTEDDWDKVVNTNLKGLFFISQAEGKAMKSTPDKIKKIINITSIEGLRSGFGPYHASKWGANGITKGMAKQLLSNNIIVNAIAPGMSVTEINPNLPKDVNDNAYLSLQPNGRYVLVEEVAELASYLASDSSNCIVGQVIAIDGGWSLN